MQNSHCLLGLVLVFFYFCWINGKHSGGVGGGPFPALSQTQFPFRLTPRGGKFLLKSTPSPGPSDAKSEEHAWRAGHWLLLLFFGHYYYYASTCNDYRDTFCILSDSYSNHFTIRGGFPQILYLYFRIRLKWGNMGTVRPVVTQSKILIYVLTFELFPLFALVLGSIVLKQVVPERRWLPTTLSTLAQISSNQGALQRWNCKRNRNEILKRHKELIFERIGPTFTHLGHSQKEKH